MQEFIDGNKTYLTAAVTLVLGGLSFAGVEVPPWVLYVLSAFGLYAVRDAVGKVERGQEGGDE